MPAALHQFGRVVRVGPSAFALAGKAAEFWSVDHPGSPPRFADRADAAAALGRLHREYGGLPSPLECAAALAEQGAVPASPRRLRFAREAAAGFRAAGEGR